MGYEEGLRNISVPVNSDLSAAQYHFVDVGTDGYLDLVGDGAKAIGVLQNKPDGSSVDDVGSVGVRGVSKVEAAEAITAGDDIASNANGEAVTATTGDIVLGRALEDASGDGSIIAVLINIAPEPLA